MTKTFTTLFALLLIAGSWSELKAQQSDYEITENFRADYEQIANWIDNAVATSDLEEIDERIESFVSEYAEHTSIINSALYPETAQEKIDDLRARFNSAAQQIATIEELEEEVERLNEEVQSFRGELADRDAAIDDLQSQLEESRASEGELSNLAQQYRESIQERDEFVVNFLSDMLERYESIDASTAGDLADQLERLDDNPVDLLKTVLGEYVNYANQATGLGAPDYLNMKAQHIYFSEWWDNFGERLTNVFDPDSPVQSREEVNDLLSNWNSAIDNRIWGALQEAFADSGIELGSFSDAGGFYSAIDSYVSNATSSARDQNRQEDLDNFQNFSSYWNGTVKAQWGDQLVTGEILTYEQISTIDQQLDNWGEAAIPTSNLMLILFLISIAVIIGLIVALVRKRGADEQA